MASEHEDEMCEGCVRGDHFPDHALCQKCDRNPIVTSESDKFVPSLFCRQVRALEVIADCMAGCVRTGEQGGYSFDVTVMD
jgi:hypothetical protein